MTTTSSPTCISLYWITPFHAPESGSVRAAASKETLAGLWNRQVSERLHVLGERAGPDVLRAVAAGGEGVLAVVRVADAAVLAEAAEAARAGR